MSIFLAKGERVLHEAPRGAIVENPEEKYITATVKGVTSYDGIIDSSEHIWKVNYGSGLYQDWTGYGAYSAGVCEAYKDRDKVYNMALRFVA